jgi:hypothetical protein
MTAVTDPFLGRSWRRLRPASTLGWVQLAGGVFAGLVVVALVAFVLQPLLAVPFGYGRHDWDQAESLRYLVVKSLRRFHAMPWWNPYACGGHPAWGATEGDASVVPWLPAYLALPLPVAIRVEVAVSALWGAAGAWLLASRFTRSAAARAFVAVVFAVNGRWALQLAAGHGWHLVYAWTPWVLFFFDRAAGVRPELGPPRWRDAVWAGACLAMMVYSGGVVPLSQTAIALVAYAVLVAAAARSERPLVALGVSAAVAVGLSAPKLLPVLAVMARHPRVVDSTETLDPTQLVQLLTNRDQPFDASHGGVPGGSWHEVGMYVGWPVVVLLLAGVVAARGRSVRSFAAIGLVFVVLGLGAFSKVAPWSLLHELPVFRSQWVPAHWLYPALLLLACVAVAGWERAMARSGRARWALEIAALIAVAAIAVDVGRVARLPLVDRMRFGGPTNADSTGPFRVESRLPAALQYQPGEWAPTTLSAEIENLGTIECNTFPPLSQFGSTLPAGHDGRPPGLGAHGVGESGYRGEAYLADGVGTATIVAWSPNAVDVRVEGARPGELVVLNQNWDPGWSVDGESAVDRDATVAGPARQPAQTLRFRYRPPWLWTGVLLFAVTVWALVVARRRGAG